VGQYSLLSPAHLAFYLSVSPCQFVLALLRSKKRKIPNLGILRDLTGQVHELVTDKLFVPEILFIFPGGIFCSKLGTVLLET